MPETDAAAAGIVEELRSRGLTIAAAESLTGGLLVAALVAIPGASRVVRGGLVAYSSDLKRSLLGVRPELLNEFGPVHPDVARQMAIGVRALLAVDSRAADVGISTTGVAGPGPQGAHPAGTAFVGLSMGSETRVIALSLRGSRETIRSAVVSESLLALEQWLGEKQVEEGMFPASSPLQTKDSGTPYRFG